MLEMENIFIAFRWLNHSTPLIRMFMLVLILLLMPTLNFLPLCLDLSLLRYRLPSRLPMMFIVDGRHDGGYYTVKDCVTIDVLPRTPGNNVYVGFMVCSNFTATKCRGLVSLNQV